jgi:hypothetical protein
MKKEDTMYYKVVTGRLTDTYGHEKIHFQSRNVEDCFQFVASRANSKLKNIRLTSNGMKVVDAFGDIVKLKKNA